MHIAQGFCFHFINGRREVRREILWLSNTILLSPAHQAEPWEEQTSSLLSPNRFVDTQPNQLPLTALIQMLEKVGKQTPTPRARPEPEEAPFTPSHLCSLPLLTQSQSQPLVQNFVFSGTFPNAFYPGQRMET